MSDTHQPAADAMILALPETAGSALYGLIDVLAAAGGLWLELVEHEPGTHMIATRIVSRGRQAFRCGNNVPVNPDLSIKDAPVPEILILPEMWLAPTDDLSDRYDDVKAWIVHCYNEGSTVYTACSGSVLLAATGLLNGREATSHWGYQDLFRTNFPDVRFNPAPNLVMGDRDARIVTAGGTTSWHDLALHIIARHCSPGEAMRIAKVYLLKLHSEGQLPYQSLVRHQPHADSVVRRAEDWLADHFRDSDVLATAIFACSIPERSLKRRFKAATGTTLIEHVQNLRIEEAKRLLEANAASVDDVAAIVGYDNPSFFRRLFKRCTGLRPGAYRRMFSHDTDAASVSHTRADFR